MHWPFLLLRSEQTSFRKKQKLLVRVEALGAWGRRGTATVRGLIASMVHVRSAATATAAITAATAIAAATAVAAAAAEAATEPTTTTVPTAAPATTAATAEVVIACVLAHSIELRGHLLPGTEKKVGQVPQRLRVIRGGDEGVGVAGLASTSGTTCTIKGQGSRCVSEYIYIYV